MDSVPPRSAILQLLLSKSQIKQQVYDSTFAAFQTFKDVLHELASEVNDEIFEVDKRIKLEYRDRGQYEAELRIAGDVLVFNMHTNVFQFDPSHKVWKTDYLQGDANNAYCGMISVYNFLTDSFKYNRMDDLGYLTERIFVNQNNHFFVEGKHQHSFDYQNFGVETITRENITKIAEAAIHYALTFDLFVPPYDTMHIVNVAQITNKADDDKIQTGKRIGFEY
ncbi:hypothetical protein FACS1894156_7490 [Bacteroidia bacterium]|nr:hypothetical protein FACS1894156_7490 [Bacteroidia bacterium]